METENWFGRIIPERPLLLTGGAHEHESPVTRCHGVSISGKLRKAMQALDTYIMTYMQALDIYAVKN